MYGKVTRETLAGLIAQEMGFPFSKAKKLVEMSISSMSDGIVHDGKLMVMNFGVFKVHSKKERPGRNPKTGEEASISPRRSVAFRQTKNLELKS